MFGNIRGHGNLDYVACWYILAARYMQENTAIRTAFVSTNSISQGEQPGILWPQLFGLGARINFAHRTFQWDSEASGKAAVHCVIVGFALEDELPKQLYDYDSVKGDPHMHEVARINPYLVDGPNVLLSSRSKPIDQAPKLGIGNQAIDDGNYLFTNAEKEAFLQKEPQAEPFFRPWVGSEEFINGEYRWCLWLGRATPSELRQMPLSMARVDATRAYRLKSTRSQTLKLAKTPRNFQVEVLPEAAYLVIPEVSSERRAFIPIGFLNSNVMASHLVRVAPDATIYDFGILTSTMHMAWVRALAGRLESRYRYSIKIVYNNYPWPDAPSAKQIAAIEAAAQNVLDVRGQFPAETLANLYDPNLMPAALTKAHRKLDQAVDKAYRRAAFKSEPERVAYLLERYAELSGAQLFDV